MQDYESQIAVAEAVASSHVPTFTNDPTGRRVDCDCSCEWRAVAMVKAGGFPSVLSAFFYHRAQVVARALGQA